jgi:3',5'-cyclic AMP phosphodiesterase CpdA
LTLRLIQLSDPHFGGVDAPAAEAALAYAREARPDLVLVTGDLTLNGLPKEFEAARDWLDRLPTPWLSTPGNHDTPYWNLPLRALTPFGRYSRYIGEAFGEAFDGEGFSARTLTTARGAQPRLDWSKGAINLDQCRLAVSGMAGAGGASFKAIACHHPLVEALDTPVTGEVHRGEAAARLLTRGGVDVILTGHVHNPFVSALPFGDKHTYSVGAGTLSTRLRGTPVSFNDIEVESDCIAVKAMGWSGSHFTPYRTWAVPRRNKSV